MLYVSFLYANRLKVLALKLANPVGSFIMYDSGYTESTGRFLILFKRHFPWPSK